MSLGGILFLKRVFFNIYGKDQPSFNRINNPKVKANNMLFFSIEFKQEAQGPLVEELIKIGLELESFALLETNKQ